MKIYNATLCAALLALASTSCDNSLPWDEKQENGELILGELILNVTKKEPQKRETRAAVDTQDFAVVITGKDDVANVKREFAKVADMPASITLPVGQYSAVAHSAGDLTKEMDAPYFKGQKDVTVSGIPTNTEINCRMVNSSIQVVYDDEFQQKFVSWTITINDGTAHVLSFTETGSKTLTYWWFDQPTKNIYVDIKATTTGGENVSASATYSKTQSKEGYADLESEYFTGGEAIVITFKPQVDPNGYINGITLDANITFDNFDDSVTIEVIDNDDNPGPGPDPGNEIEITSIPADGVVNALYGQTEDFPQVQYDFVFPTGLKNLLVKVDSNNDSFIFATSLMGLTEGDGLDLTSNDAKQLSDLFPLPTVGSTTYQFSLSETIWGLLTNAPGYTGTHTFTLKAVDKNGKTKSGKLTIHVNE